MSVKKVPVQDEFPYQHNVLDFITTAAFATLVTNWVPGDFGKRYIITDSTHANEIVFFNSASVATFLYLVPTEGWLVFDEDSNKYYKFITSWTEYIGQAGPTGATGATGVGVDIFYGVSWNESTDAYTRTGIVSGQTKGVTLADYFLPIQAKMRRCVVLDNGSKLLFRCN